MKTYTAQYHGQVMSVQARTPFEAQFLAAISFRIPGKLQYLVLIK